MRIEEHQPRGRPPKRKLVPRLTEQEFERARQKKRNGNGGKQTRGERVVEWIETVCYVPEGAGVGQPIKLLPWQVTWIEDIYDNPHITRRAILSIARKNG